MTSLSILPSATFASNLQCIEIGILAGRGTALKHSFRHFHDVVHLFVLVVDKAGNVRNDDIVGLGKRSALRSACTGMHIRYLKLQKPYCLLDTKFRVTHISPIYRSDPNSKRHIACCFLSIDKMAALNRLSQRIKENFQVCTEAVRRI